MPDLFDPAGNPVDAIQTGEGAADEYDEGKKSSAKASSAKESGKDIAARVGEMDDEELTSFEKHETKVVKEAVAAEQAKRAEAAAAADDSSKSE